SNRIPRTGENRSTCLPPKASILLPSSRKWSSGRPPTRRPTIKRLSGSSNRTKNSSWQPFENGGQTRPIAEKITKSRANRLSSVRPKRLHDVDASRPCCRQCRRDDRGGKQNEG